MKARTLISMALVAVAGIVHADAEDRIYDFHDSYYVANGVNPTLLAGRVTAPSAAAVNDTPFFSHQKNVRLIRTAAAYGHNGNIFFFSPIANCPPQAFLPNAAGVKARQLADRYAEFVFPMRGSDPVGFGNSRQSVVLDMSGGFQSNNPLGLWVRVWVNYTDRAFNTAGGRQALNALARRNGLAKDLTPFIKTKSEIEDLFKKGYVTKLKRTDTLAYSVCPVIKDPTDGGIAPDAVFNPARRPDGTLLEPWFYNAFQNLQTFGDWD
jgi:hypothetical protein